MKYASLLFLVAFVLLTGCREYVVDPGISLTPPTPPDAPVVQLKGPDRVLLGYDYEFKAEAKTGMRYEWTVDGPPGLAGEGNGTRYYRGIAQATGPATVRVYLLDAADNVTGYAQRDVRVVAQL